MGQFLLILKIIIYDKRYRFIEKMCYTNYQADMILSDIKDSAPGPDVITYSMIKNLHETALTELLAIMNAMWSGGFFVDEWRRSTLLSFLKSGRDPSSPNSYRPVNLTSAICKLMEKIAGD